MMYSHFSIWYTMKTAPVGKDRRLGSQSFIWKSIIYINHAKYAENHMQQVRIYHVYPDIEKKRETRL